MCHVVNVPQNHIEVRFPVQGFGAGVQSFDNATWRGLIVFVVADEVVGLCY